MKLMSFNKVLFLLCLIIVSCAKEEIEINFEKQNSPFDIIIEGGILTLNGKQYLKITKPHSLSIDTIMPVSGAKVELSDRENTYLYEETTVPGEYESILQIKGEIGRFYTLEVNYNGKIYYASDSMIAVESISLNELPIREISYDYNGRIYTYSSIHTFGYESANLWIINHYYDSLDSHIFLNPKQIIKYPIMLYTHIGALPQGLFPLGFSSTGDAGEPNDTTEYIKLSLSDNYYKYLISMFNLTVWSSGIFSTIPGNTYTNVSEGGTGYFFASDVKKIKVQYKDLKTIDE